MRCWERGGEVHFEGGSVEGSADDLLSLASVEVDVAAEFSHGGGYIFAFLIQVHGKSDVYCKISIMHRSSYIYTVYIERER